MLHFATCWAEKLNSFVFCALPLVPVNDFGYKFKNYLTSLKYNGHSKDRAIVHKTQDQVDIRKYLEASWEILLYFFFYFLSLFFMIFYSPSPLDTVSFCLSTFPTLLRFLDYVECSVHSIPCYTSFQ